MKSYLHRVPESERRAAEIVNGAVSEVTADPDSPDSDPPVFLTNSGIVCLDFPRSTYEMPVPRSQKYSERS